MSIASLPALAQTPYAATKITYMALLANQQYPNRDKTRDTWTADVVTAWVNLALYDTNGSFLSHTSSFLLQPA